MDKNKEAQIRSLVEKNLPDWAKACQSGEADGLLLHQDAFAADYQEDELYLLGAAIKYAGLYNREVRIHGTNRETVE